MAKKKKSLMDELLEEPILTKQTGSTKKVSVATTPKQRTASAFEEIAPVRKTQNNLLSREEILSPVNIGKQKESTAIALNKPKPKDDSTLFGTTANVLKTFGQGMMKAEEGMFIDAPSAILSKLILTGSKTTGKIASIFDNDLGNKIIAKGMEASNKLNEIAEQDWTSNALEAYGWNRKLDNGKTVTETLESQSAITSNDLLGKAVEGLGGMAPSILLGGLIGSAGAGAKTAEEIDKINKLQKTISYSSLGARSFGGAYEQALQSGATQDQALAYGISSAGVEIGTEWLSGGIPGVKGTAGGGLDELFGKYVLKEGVEETSKSLSKAIVKSLYKTSMEGVEEEISQLLEPYIKQFTYEYDNDKSFSENFQEATNKVSFQEIMEAGIVGSLTAVLLGDVNISDMKTGYQNTQAINNTIANEIETQQNMLGRELTKEESNAIKTEIKDHANNVNQYGEEIANRIIDVKNNNTSTEGLDLEQSYKAYNGEKKYTKEISNIQKFMNNRNIDARFDATMFDNNEQNAIWTTQDGKDNVIFNPNASADQVIQNIATHEMTHDIINQKTEAGTSLFNDVLENIKSQENYAEQRQEIEDLYAKYYDRNSEDFSAKVDEEMVANELGKNLGTQEYINRLVNEKPNLAKRIYNWVVDKLDNIGKSEEYKEQKAYWKSVADKFEVAYNEQKTATGEDKTAYSVNKDNLGAIQNLNNIEGYEVQEDYYPYDNVIGHSFGLKTKEGTAHLQIRETADEVYLNMINTRLGNSTVEKGAGTKILNNLKEYSDKTGKRLVIAGEVGSAKGFYDKFDWLKPTKGEIYDDDGNLFDISSPNRIYEPSTSTTTKYSLTKDSEGRTLSKEQQEYFKDSKVVDESGNLKVMYRGTPTPGKTVFESQKGGGNKEINEYGIYFTDSEAFADRFAYEQLPSDTGSEMFFKPGKRGAVEQAYLNIKNPLDFSTLTKEDFANLYDNYKSDMASQIVSKDQFINDMINWQQNYGNHQLMKGYLDLEKIAKNSDYDGIIARVDTFANNDNAKEYIVFNSNQIKNIDNTSPTTNPDIRYSLTKDNTGRELSEGQKEYFKDSKVRDENNDLKVVYHGTPNNFTKFSYDKLGTNGTLLGKGFYLTDDINVAQAYANKGKAGKVMELYADIKKPLRWGEKTISKEQYKTFVEAVNEETNGTLFADYSGEYSEKGSQQYNSTLNDILMDYEYGGDDIDLVSGILNSTGMSWDKGYKILTDTTGYDGIIVTTDVYDSGEGNVYIPFQSNQIKNVDNLNPTEDADIRYSMQQDVAPVTEGTRTTYGELFENNIAPIREDLSNITEQMNNLSNQIETLQNQLETTPQGYVETYNEQRNENIPTRNLTEEDANTLQDALMQDEGYLRSLDEQANQTTDNTQLVDKLTNEVTRRLDLEKGQRDTLKGIIQKSIDNGYSADELSYELYKEFSESSYEMTNQEAVEAKKLIKSMPVNVSDAIKKDITDYGDFRRRNFGKINFSKSGVPVDALYAELSDKMPYYFPSDIIAPSDQLQKIAEVANLSSKVTETIDVEPEYFDDIADYVTNTVLTDEYNAQMNADYDLEKNIQFDNAEDIVPTTIRTQDSIEDYIENRDIAPVKPDKTQQRQERAEQRSRAYRIYREMITNRNAVIDDYSRASGNREIKFKGDKYNSSQSEANFNISNKQTDINGNWIGKGLNEIFEPVEKAGLGRAFDDYLFNKSNIERHNVGKGSVVPVEVSRQLVAQYERENPSFKSTAEEVYKFIDNYSKEQVDSGILAKEKYDDFRGEFGIYGDYVPFRLENLDKSRYYDDSGEAKAVSTFKRSKGGASDLSGLMGMKDAIANQVRASKGAIAFNELAKEIVQTNGRDSEIFDVDTRTDITNTNDALYKTEDGDYILSAYINGEKVSTKISEELYNELSRANEDRIKQLEKDFSVVTNPLQKMSGWRRSILTSKNPAFLLRNFFKDAGDAVINSKYTKDMMANYTGLAKGHKPAMIELAQAKTKTAQRFLAQYGVDGTWGDYSNISKSKNVFNKIAKANQLVELAPRYAEYLASLQNGCSEAEALYNAREVTTNFGRGGYITKALNRNGFTFLNANVQGLSKLVRNLSGENGVKGVTSVVVKGALFAVLPSILNHILYGLGDDKDEEYEALPDYIKDNYFLIKTEGNKFVRIPKGRVNAVFGSLARRMIEAGEGEGFDFKEWGENAWSQIGVGDSSGVQTIFTPLRQAFGSKNGEAWYGGDIVPTRLQNKPAGEQTDASIDAISNFIGENLGISPYKINYVLDQYSGGIGDMFLPMITPETSSGAEKPSEYLLAPIKDSFVVNSIDDNKYAGDFYDLKDKLQIQSNSDKATDEDKVKYKYMSGISSDMSELYKERREVQADTTLGKKAKYEKVQIIQNEINNLAKEALSNYQNVSSSDNYSNINDSEYYKNSEGKWTEVKEEEQEFTAGLSNAEKDLYYKTKNKISDISSVYSAKLKQLSKNDPKKSQIYADRKEDITRAIVNSGLDNETKAMVYAKYYSNKDTMTNVVNAGYNVDTYITALNDIEQLRTKYSQKNGYTTAQRKAKTIAYINSLNMEVPQKAMMIRNYYTSFRQYNNDIVNFVSNLDISYEDKKAILEDTGMSVKGNRVSWK